MTYILSLSAQSGQVIGIVRGCSTCKSSTGSCLDRRCEPYRSLGDLIYTAYELCYCSEEKCNSNINTEIQTTTTETTTENNSSIQIRGAHGQRF